MNTQIRNKIRVKTPQTAHEAQLHYAKEVEDQSVANLIAQFNIAIAREEPLKPIYILPLYFARPAGFYKLSNVMRRFTDSLEDAGWKVRQLTVAECIVTVTVSAKQLH